MGEYPLFPFANAIATTANSVVANFSAHSVEKKKIISHCWIKQWQRKWVVNANAFALRLRQVG